MHYTDVLTMHDGLNLVVQNYGFAAIFYLIFSVFGAPGLYVMLLVLNFVICYLLYKICMLISNKNLNLSLVLMMVTNLLLVYSTFVTTRAQMVSYVIFLGLIYVLELYVKTGKSKFLAWLPVLSLLQINLHSSVWWMLILVWLVYVIDSIKAPKIHLQGYKTKPLLIVGALMFACGFLNPYGIKMITYIFTSYGKSTINNLVDEMHPFSPFRNGYMFFTYVSLAAVMVLYIFGKKKNVRGRYLLMFFGFLALGINTSKGMSEFILVMFFPLALLYKDVSLGKLLDMAKIGRDALIIWAGVVCFAIFVALGSIVVFTVPSYPNETSVKVLDTIDADVGEKDKKELKIYTGYNDGGYVEYRGYRSYLDPRAEVFLKINNGKEDILDEWVDFRKGKTKVSDFVEKYNFDYIWAVGDYDPFYDFENENYVVIYENEEEETKLYKILDKLQKV